MKCYSFKSNFLKNGTYIERIVYGVEKQEKKSLLNHYKNKVLGKLDTHNVLPCKAQRYIHSRSETKSILRQ